MTPSTLSADQLAALFMEQKAGLEKLHNLLVEEHRVVELRDAEQLHQIASYKQDMVLELEQSELAIQREMRSRSLPLNNEGIHQLIHSYPENDAEALDKLWEQLADIADKCQVQNQVNGRIIMASQASIQQAQGILTGTLNSGVYTRRGKTEYSKANHTSSSTKV